VNKGFKLIGVSDDPECSDRNTESAAYDAALALLNPKNDARIGKQFEDVIATYRLHFLHDVGPLFQPVSKKVLLSQARDVIKISDLLSRCIAKFYVLGMPSSLAVTETATMQECLAKSQILDGLLQELQMRAKWIILQINQLKHQRTIYPLPATGEAFDMELAEVWVKAGHKFTSTTEGRTAKFFLHAYEAATGKERDTVSRALTNARRFLESGMKRPTSDQINRAARAKRKTTVDKIQRGRRENH
jgi:hypothetical protein